MSNKFGAVDSHPVPGPGVTESFWSAGTKSKVTVFKCLPFFFCMGSGLFGSGTVELDSVDWGHVTYDQDGDYAEASLTDGTVYMGTQSDLSLKPHHRGYRLYSLSGVPGDVEVVRVRYEAPLQREKADRKTWVGAGPFSADLEEFRGLDPRDKYSAIGKPEGLFLVRNPRNSTQEGTADASVNNYCSWESNPGGIFGVSLYAEVPSDFLKDSWYSNSALRLFVDFLPMDNFPVTASDREFPDKVEVQWDAAPGADAYVIFRGDNSTFDEAEILENEYIGSSYSDTGREPDSTYFYWIAGRNDIGVGQPNGPHEGRTASVVITRYLISGNVTYNGTGLVDTGISLSGGGGSTATDGNGDFSIEVDAGWSGSITPNKPGYSFSPSSRSLVNVGSNQPGQDFTAAPMPTSVSLSGDLAFGAVEVGAVSKRGLTIRNDGDATLTVSNIESPSGFRCVWSGDILSGQSVMVEVFFEPTLPGNYSGEIVVHGNIIGGQAGISASGVGYIPNTAPTVGEISDRSVDEDGSTGAIGFVVDDEETAPADLTVSAVSSDTGLVALSGIAFGGSGANRTVTVTPLPNQSGEVTITVKVSDGVLNASEAFVLTVNPVNDAPEISDIPGVAISEDSSTGEIPFVISDEETSAANLTLTKDSSNLSLVPVGNIVFGGAGSNRTVTVTPLENQSGSSTITVTVSDGQKTSSDTFAVTVSDVNGTPTITRISSQSIDEDGSTGAIGFVVDDEETAPADLTVSAVSSDTGLVALSGIAFGGSGANRTVTVTPLPNQSGEVTITVKVSDGVLNASEAFVLTVNPVNDAPEISDIADQTISVDSDTGAIGFTVSDLESTPGSLIVTSSSSNLGLVPVGNIVFGGAGGNRTVTVTPTASQSGSTTITVTVSDGQKTGSDTFDVTVTGANSAPTITKISDRTIDEDATTGAIGFVVDDLETAPGDLTVTAVSSGTGLVPISNIVLGGNGADRTVTVTPSPDRNGKVRITLTVSDGTDSSSEDFNVTVNPVNDAPEVGYIPNQAIAMNSDTGPIEFSVSDLERPSTALALSGESSNTALVNTSRIAFGGYGDIRTVTVLPLPNRSGEATITVTVSDGLLETSESFLISVSDGAETVSIVITSPANGVELSEGDPIEVSGMVSDPSKVLRVEMLVGGEKIAEDSSSPYSFSWSGATVGDHIIGLRAVLKENGTVDSTTVMVTVGPSDVTEVLSPSITPDGGTHMGMVEASLSTKTDGALIYFTTDGSEPTTASSLYLAEILIEKSVTLKARAFREGSDPSAVSVADFVIEPGFVTRSVEALADVSVSASEVQTPNLRVTLSVVPPDPDAPYSLIEVLPVGWTAMNISGGGVWDPDNSRIEWSSLEGPLVLTYDLTGTDDPRTAQQILGGLGGHVEYANQSIPIVSYPLVSVLENLSSRSRAGTGAEILIPGFVVVGSGEKTFLIRAVGPGLERYGVSGFLEDPVMVLVDGLGDEIDTNDDWSDGTDQLLVESITARIGAFALDSGSRDAALVARLAQGKYTVKVSGQDDSVGVALVEVYDAGVDPASDIRLMNVSNRGVVGTGASVMIPGFVVDGEMDKTVLIRAIGPGLAQYGVSGVLGDPRLEVFRSGETAPISGATNNDWGDAANSELIAAASSRIGAFPLENGSADAVLLIRLEPGVYTIKASGTGGTTGVALVEVYILGDDIVGPN